MEINMKTCSIKNEYYTITVSTLGAELISVKADDGYEYMWQNEQGGFWDSHAPLLFPVCGRLLNQKYTFCGKEYEMDVHGFVKDFEFAVASKEGSHITMTLSSSEATKKIYPVDFTVVADYELRGEEIIFSFKVTNRDKTVMPYMFGWHPGFNLPTGDGLDINDYKLYLGDISELTWHPLQNGPFFSPIRNAYPLESGSYKFVEDEIYKNDTMIFTGHKNSLKMLADGHPYELSLSWSDNLPYLCIWKDEFNAAKFICLEPWSDVPGDGVTEENFDTREMHRLMPGKSETYTYKLKIKH